MKNGMKAFLLGGKNLKGKTGVLAAVASAAIGIVGTVVATAIGNKMAYKADREIDVEEEAKELETDATEVKEGAEEVVEEETDKKG